METPELNVVTGAFGYTGKYITRKLLSMGKRVRTLTGHPARQNPFGDQGASFLSTVDECSLGKAVPGHILRQIRQHCVVDSLVRYVPVLASSHYRDVAMDAEHLHQELLQVRPVVLAVAVGHL
ncbi:hypothetical protein HKBW3S42_00813 [Candidatus Hakubella thermalkaliphila]|uniref:Uncharacterized protein n=1 Tax=Candidatus Hakubella thermalkaliphila TaxID=2754717 RepID=A0A6V8PIR2_9ACTN|nr:hypothetical protein HKBW3S42_00813 [Candidatus Hakubella thermalkaliphila]